MSSKKYLRFNDFSDIGKRIKKIRGSLNQARFGEVFGVSQNTVSQWEKGKSLTDEETLKKIAGYGGVTLDWLLRGDQAAPPSQIREAMPEDYAARLSDLEISLITEVLECVRDVIKARRLKFTSAQEARLIVKAYDDCRAAHEHPSVYMIERLLLFVD